MPRFVPSILGEHKEEELEGGSDQTLERQNDEELNSLHGKIKALRSVTIDILDDSRGQNDQLDRSTNTFSNFANSLFSTSRHHSRSMASTSTLRQYRMIVYVVGAVLVLWLLLKVRHFGAGSTPASAPGEI